MLKNIKNLLFFFKNLRRYPHKSEIRIKAVLKNTWLYGDFGQPHEKATYSKYQDFKQKTLNDYDKLEYFLKGAP